MATQRLLQRQNPDGGWGWWANDESRPFVSSYVTFGLVRAQAAGFAVDSAALERAIDYLQRQLRPVDALEGYELNQQAFILYVLAEAGQGDVGRTTALYQVRQRLADYGKALLALTFGLLDDPTSAQRIGVLLDDLNSAALVSATGAHWEEESIDWWTMNSDLRSTALVLDAMARLDPQNALAPNAVRWLMSTRSDGHWATTQENVWSLIALTDWMVAAGELEGDYSYNVLLNDAELASGSVDVNNVGQPVELRVAVAELLQDHANGLTISRFAEGSQSGDGQLYYTAFLETFLPAAELQAMDRGVVVAQQYRLVDPITGEASDQPISEAQVGDTIQVKLTIVAPTDLHYLVVESPLPAAPRPSIPACSTPAWSTKIPAWSRPMVHGRGSGGRRLRPICATRRWPSSPPSSPPAPMSTPTRCAPACRASSRSCRPSPIRCTSRRCGGAARGRSLGSVNGER